MRTFVVNTIRLAMAVLFMLGSLSVQAKAQQYGANGLLMGAGSGTLAGQAIGRDTEETLIGAAAGGMAGYMIGNEMDTAVYAGSYGLTHPVTFYPSTSRHVFPHRHGSFCRDFIVIERHHGQLREVVKTVCRDRHLKHFRGDRHHHFRFDHRHHFRDDHRKNFHRDHRHHGKGGNRHHR